jgi:hypothetical protein
MNDLLNALAEFITKPIFRWFFFGLSLVLNLITFLNQPQRFSSLKAFTGLPFKWHLYLVASISAISFCFTAFGLWLNIPFTKYLPEYWYVYLFIIYISIVTQVTIDSKEITDDGTFNPPPSYMFPDSYRVMFSYASLVVNTIILIQDYIYSGIVDITKKTILSRYVLERFGGWYSGNYLDFVYNWSGLTDVIIAMYELYLQQTFIACEYGLPASWNF